MEKIQMWVKLSIIIYIIMAVEHHHQNLNREVFFWRPKTHKKINLDPTWVILNLQVNLHLLSVFPDILKSQSYPANCHPTKLGSSRSLLSAMWTLELSSNVMLNWWLLFTINLLIHFIFDYLLHAGVMW